MSDLTRTDDSTTAFGPSHQHDCPWCPFNVIEPPAQMTTTWGTNGTYTLKMTRVAWEIPMVQHWFEDHPEHAQLVFPGVALVSDAVLTTAARAQQAMTDQLRSMLVPLARWPR